MQPGILGPGGLAVASIHPCHPSRIWVAAGVVYRYRSMTRVIDMPGLAGGRELWRPRRRSRADEASACRPRPNGTARNHRTDQP